MGSSIYVSPLHFLELDWARSASFSFGLPDEVPDPRPLPCVVDVLTALRAANYHDEVSLHAQDKAEPQDDTPVETVSFRKPTSRAALDAACALTAVTGPVFVFDDSADCVFVIQPGVQPDDLAASWPW